ncbi:MAG: VWA domain-containing protein [Methanomicrobiaceae archaeon]|nr:VWA domain-containing protein [Methanomicrobiaceae archaeon]
MTGFKWKGRLTAAFILLIFLISAVNALESDEILIQSDRNWMTAGGDPASIEVIVNNVSVTVQSVEFESFMVVNSMPLASLAPTGTVTPSVDTGSPWKTDFYCERSGVAEIHVTLNYIDNGSPASMLKTFQQKVDHAPMYSLGTPDYLYETTVNEAVTITVSALDKYGNLVDSKKEDDVGGTPESFEMISSPETSEFWDGLGFNNNSIKLYVNSTGYATALFRVSEIAGTNLVNIIPPSGISPNLLTIKGLANAEPADIVVSVSPASGDPPYQPADGISKFYIIYQLVDQWGNPSGNRTLYINSTDLTEPAFYRTSNSLGRIEISYGPQVIKGIYTLIASSVDNGSVSVTTDLEFVSTAPTDMLLTANPQVMPSHDVDTGFTSAIRAKIIDEKGNPVKGETVTFSIIPGAYPLSQVAGPYLQSASAESDQNGQAIVKFVPGEFETDWDSLNYSKQSSASCQVRAEWNSTVRYINLEWKNYPYLSVLTNVTPETVKVNDTVKVTIQLVGDGWALQPDPIDVVSVADRSGSMIWDYPDRMVSLMAAMKVFSNEMHDGRDRVGLTSFGSTKGSNICVSGNDIGIDDYSGDDSAYKSLYYPGSGVTDYADYATVDLALTTDLAAFDAEVDNIVPRGGTPMRYGIYKAIKHVRDNGREDAVKAIIVLSDGDYNDYGDPLARSGKSYTYFSDLSSQEQDMRVFAGNNNITIFSIAFADGMSSSGRQVMERLAEDTGGKYYYAPDGEELKDVYKDIAGELKEAAGVNTEMELMFQNVEINNVTVPNTGGDAVLEYVYDPDDSTLIENFYSNGTHTSVTEDQRAWWTENISLHFDVGTVYLNQTWQTTFLLKVLKPGNINLFNDTSFISFNGGADTLELPDTFITAVADLNSTGINFTALDVSGFHITNPGDITDTIDLEWNLDYTGSSSASQNLYYLRLGDNVWIPFKVLPGVGGPVSTMTQQSQLGIVDLPPGEYRLRLIASAADTADDMEELSTTIMIGASSGAYIKIE